MTVKTKAELIENGSMIPIVTRERAATAIASVQDPPTIYQVCSRCGTQKKKSEFSNGRRECKT